jgi:hypothetical protein
VTEPLIATALSARARVHLVDEPIAVIIKGVTALLLDWGSSTADQVTLHAESTTAMAADLTF